MVKKSEDVFLEVKDEADKFKVIEDIVRYSTEIKVKGLAPMGNVFLVSPRSITGHEVLCKVVGSAFIDPNDKNVIVQFDHYEHKFIAQVKFRQAADFLYLDFNTKLYRVQRREDFRLRLPRSFQGKLTINLDGNKYPCSLIDISAGGCRIEARKRDFTVKIDQQFPAIFSAAGRDQLPVEINVRHVGPHPDKDDFNSLGLQFVNQTEIVKNRMAALVMDLYREFFTKRS